MAKRGRKPGSYGRYDETGRKQSEFGEYLHKLYKDQTGKKLSQTLLAEAVGIPAPTLTLMLQDDKELVRGERLYNLFNRLAQLLEQDHITLFEDQAIELLMKIDKDCLNEEQKKVFLKRLIQELLVKREYKTRWEQLPFLGRDKDIQDIFRYFFEKKHFLTIVGVPGVGKSELAWQVREELRIYGDFCTPDPIHFDGVTSAEEVEQKITNALSRSDRQQKQKTLLVLNDCEQIAENVEALEKINHFYHSDPFLAILATSRVLLSYEKYPFDENSLASLAVPQELTDQVKQLESYDAIQLFCESARRTNRKFRLTDQNASDAAKICIGLGGLPLAMIIAGSLISSKKPKELYKMLVDRSIQESKLPYKPPQDRLISLNALIDVSYKLLGEDAEHGMQLQALFRRIGLFINECEVEAVAVACSLNDDLPSDPDNDGFRDMLTKLATHHIIISQNNWVQIAHITLRDYALRKVSPKETKNFYQQLALYYCRFALHYALSHKTGRTRRLREILNSFYSEEELAELAEYWQEARKAERKKTKKAWSEAIQKQGKDIEVAYWFMSWRRLRFIEYKTTRLLGEGEEKALKRIRAFGFTQSSHINLENSLEEAGQAGEDIGDVIEEALDAVSQASEDIEDVIEEAPSEYFVVRAKVERDRDTPYNPFYSLLEYLLAEEDLTRMVLPSPAFRSKPPNLVWLVQTQFVFEVYGITIFDFIYASGGVKGPIPLTIREPYDWLIAYSKGL